MPKINTKYSYQSFKGKTFTDVDPAEFNDSEIVGSSFYQQGKPYTKVFPDGTKGLVISGSYNLDNVDVQPEITLSGTGTNKQILVQNNHAYYLVDKDEKPIEPRDRDIFIAFGLSVDPKDIPVAPLAEPILVTYDPKVIEQREITAAKADESWIKEKLAEDKVAAVEVR